MYILSLKCHSRSYLSNYITTGEWTEMIELHTYLDANFSATHIVHPPKCSDTLDIYPIFLIKIYYSHSLVFCIGTR